MYYNKQYRVCAKTSIHNPRDNGRYIVICLDTFPTEEEANKYLAYLKKCGNLSNWDYHIQVWEYRRVS